MAGGNHERSPLLQNGGENGHTDNDAEVKWEPNVPDFHMPNPSSDHRLLQRRQGEPKELDKGTEIPQRCNYSIHGEFVHRISEVVQQPPLITPSPLAARILHVYPGYR